MESQQAEGTVRTRLDDTTALDRSGRVVGKPEVTRLLPQQCQAQVIALWHADTESMLVDAELHLPRVITILYGDS
jgi:hypothetical protein